MAIRYLACNHYKYAVDVKNHLWRDIVEQDDAEAILAGDADGADLVEDAGITQVLDGFGGEDGFKSLLGDGGVVALVEVADRAVLGEGDGGAVGEDNVVGLLNEVLGAFGNGIVLLVVFQEVPCLCGHILGILAAADGDAGAAVEEDGLGGHGHAVFHNYTIVAGLSGGGCKGSCAHECGCA